eukprot:13574641-Ditylum_brightwellii.AAC.1
MKYSTLKKDILSYKGKGEANVRGPEAAYDFSANTMSTRKSHHQLMLKRTKMMNLRWIQMMTRMILTSKPPLLQQNKKLTIT